jgi:hypothetical protein
MRPPPQQPALRANLAVLAVVVLLISLVVAAGVWHGAQRNPRPVATATFGPAWRCEQGSAVVGADVCDRYPRPAPPVGPTAVRAPPPTSETTAVP